MSLDLAWISTSLSMARFDELLPVAAARAPRGVHRFRVQPSSRGTVARVDDGDAKSWAQVVSAVAQGTCLAATVLNGYWAVDVYDRGEHVLFLDDTGRFGPLLGGDVERTAKLLGTEAATIRRYHALLLETFETAEPSGRAFESDFFEATDPFGHSELVAKCLALGGYPHEGFDAAAIRDVAGACDAWSLSPPLPPSVAAPDSVPASLAYEHLDEQRQAIVWASRWFELSPKLALAVVHSLRQHDIIEPAAAARVDWLELCASLQSDASRVADAIRMVEAWLAPDAPGAVNQLLMREEIVTLASLIRKFDDSVGSSLLARAEQRMEPEFQVGDGEFL